MGPGIQVPVSIGFPSQPPQPQPLPESDNPYKPDPYEEVMDSFVPPEYKPIPEPEWATYVPGYHSGRKNWKLHPKKNNAYNSMTTHKHGGCIVYHLEEVKGKKQWVEVERVYRGVVTKAKS
jgi:hypothetical protein